MIHVIAIIEVAPGRRDEFVEIFKALVPQVLAEEGCIDYGPTVDAETPIGAQQRLGDNKVTIVERWESIAALEAHLAAPHMNAYRESVKGIAVGTTLHILQPA
jgi:quinol monooxygenase YgiN